MIPKSRNRFRERIMRQRTRPPVDAVAIFVSAPDPNKGGSVRNLITDVPGLKVGHAEDARLASGVTAIVFDEPAVASMDLRGGAPGTRDTELLRPEETVERV